MALSFARCVYRANSQRDAEKEGQSLSKPFSSRPPGYLFQSYVALYLGVSIEARGKSDTRQVARDKAERARRLDSSRVVDHAGCESRCGTSNVLTLA